MRVLALAKYGDGAASTRQRICQYSPLLARAGIHLDLNVLLDNDYVRSLAGDTRASPARIIASYWRRIFSLLVGRRYDLYWVYADLFPYLPSIFDRILFRQGKPVVVEWDDAFFEGYARHRNWLVRSLLTKKLDKLVKRADVLICGNAYLYEYASDFGVRRLIVPTVVDTDLYRPAKTSGQLTIGWIGSPSSWPNCRSILPLLSQLCEQHDARFRIVGAGPVERSDRHPRFEFVGWSAEHEIAEVQSFDIGIMPLLDEPFQRGKSGYKLVQYMACGVPSVASPVGVNADMLGEGSVGFLAPDTDAWRTALTTLLSDPALRSTMGRAARERAVSEYSLQSQAPRLIALFKELAER